MSRERFIVDPTGAARARGLARSLPGSTSVHCIDGEYVTTAGIAERLGVKPRTASEKLSVARKMDGPVTWDRLREVSSHG